LKENAISPFVTDISKRLHKDINPLLHFTKSLLLPIQIPLDIQAERPDSTPYLFQRNIAPLIAVKAGDITEVDLLFRIVFGRIPDV